LNSWKLIDKFGSKLFYQKVDDKHFSVQVEVPITEQFFGWLCGFGRRVKIISPPSIQDKFKEYLDKIRGIY
jgi:predicted DNA-binding transcriptional regulator YafY